MSDKRTGAEELRITVSNLNAMREGFNDGFTAEQLLQLMRMCWASDWDFLPDQWTGRQVSEALGGKVPRWDDNERPVYK